LKTVDGGRVTVSVADQTGRFWFDAVRLQHEWNANPSFEGGLSSWDASRLGSASGLVSDHVSDGDASVRMSGSGDHVLMQRISMSGGANKRMILSGWNRTRGTSSDGGPVAFIAVFRNADGTSTSSRLELPRSSHDWVYREALVTSAKPFTRLDVYAIFYDQTGASWFDGVRIRNA
jgi:hypothetical protein